MRIVHIINLSNRIISGIKTSLSNLVPVQESLGNEVKVVNLCQNDSPAINKEIYINGIKNVIIQLNEYSPDVVIFHGGYVIKFYILAFFLRKKKIPYVFVPHGGTSKYNIEKRKLLKTIVNILFTQHFVAKASGIIFLNENERNNSIFRNKIKKYGIVPNGINIPSQSNYSKDLSLPIRYIFLSRIDIKYKGLDILLKAIEKCCGENKNMNLEFIFYGGNNNIKIVDEFRKMINETDGPVSFQREVFGKQKEKVYAKANIYVLPSLSEGMPLSVLEALSYGCPCIVTPQTNMADLIIKNDAGWVTDPNIDSIAKSIYQSYLDYTNFGDRLIDNAINAVKPFRWEYIGRKSIQEYLRFLQ